MECVLLLRAQAKHVAFMALGSLAGAGLVLLALSFVNGGDGFAFCTATARFGWVVPLIAGLVIGGVSLLLLDGGSRREPEQARELGARSCMSCGSSVIDEWRMCPDCGELLECDVNAQHISPERA